MSDDQLPPPGDEALPTEPASEPEAPAAPPACTNCAAPLDDDQTYCLECGTPTPAAPPLRKIGRNIAAVSTALFLLGGGAGALTYALAKGNSAGKSGTGPTLPIVSAGSTQLVPSTSTGSTGISEGTLPSDTTGGSTGTAGTDTSGTSGTSSTDTSGLPAVTGVTDSGTVTADTTGSTTASVVTDSSTLGGTTSSDSTESVPSTSSADSTESTPTTESTPDLGTPGAGTASGWPSGKVGWTVQVSSVRKAADARRLAKRISAAGQPAGVFLSSDYSTYREKGYWVVFSGVYATQAAAAAHKAALGTKYGPTIIHKVAA